MRSHEPKGIRLGIARGITYGLFGPPQEFMPQLRSLGAGLARVYVYWNQVEPEPGHFDWKVVDSFLEQLIVEEEVWITVCSSSLWATRQSTDFLPPSPALDKDAYYRFVRALVTRAGGRVKYWQCNNEPSNTGLLWAGTAPEYVSQLGAFHRAVRSADPSASIVLGGCGYDVLSDSPDGPARLFFDHVLSAGRELFDLFALHLYDDPRRIPAHVETARTMMQAHGYEHPIVIGEYNGPTLFEWPELDGILQQTMMSAFSGSGSNDHGSNDLSTAELVAGANQETPERRAMRALYAVMPDLPAPLQMFMAGCPPELDERRDRINCRQIVTRNILAMSAGVRRTVCWLLAPEVANYEDPFTMMELMHGKLPLLAFEGDRISRCRPAAETFRLLASLVDGADSVTRVMIDGSPPGINSFRIDRPGREPSVVLWQDGDAFSGEEQPTACVAVPWRWEAARVIDVFGASQSVAVHSGSVHVAVPVTPVFVSVPQPSVP